MDSALVGPILSSIVLPRLLQETTDILDVEMEMLKLHDTLSTIQAVLDDAERRQFKEKAVREWLLKLKSAAYDAQAILDDCEINGLRLRQRMGSSMWMSLRFLRVWPRRKMGRKIKRLRERLDGIDADRRQFNLSANAGNSSWLGENDGREPSISLLDPKVYGREEDKENLVELLLNGDVNIVSIPVLGMGGLGKTTLAQLVYNDARVETHFGIRIWVCVSEEFRLERLLRAIIESVTEKVCNLTELDPLQRSLRDTLAGKLRDTPAEKRFLLIVLDDVWQVEESVWEALKRILMCAAPGIAFIATTRMERVALMMGSAETLYRLSELDNLSCWELFEWKDRKKGKSGSNR